MEQHGELEEFLGIKFKDYTQLEMALTHPSYINESGGDALSSNMRLAFLGDAVLGFIVTEDLCTRLPQLPPGDLTRMRSRLVSGESLSKLAIGLGLDRRLLMGVGERGAGGAQSQRNLATVLEAVIGAIYLDLGLEKARQVVLRIMEAETSAIAKRGIPRDFKSILQEELQKAQKGSPIYRTIGVSGSQHRPSFTVEVVAVDEVLGVGSGSSKQEAQREAARQALAKLGLPN